MSSGVAVEALTLTLGAFRLNKLDFVLSRGEILVILGPNGSGKSVTLETIAGFHRPDRGRVLIQGRNVTALPPERRSRLRGAEFRAFPSPQRRPERGHRPAARARRYRARGRVPAAGRHRRAA